MVPTKIGIEKDAAAKIKSSDAATAYQSCGLCNHAFAMRFMLEDDLTVEQAVKRAISSSLGARTKSTVRKMYDLPVSMILDGKEPYISMKCFYPGKQDVSSSESYGEEYFAITKRSTIVDELKNQLDLDQYELLFNKSDKRAFSLYNIYIKGYGSR